MKGRNFTVSARALVRLYTGAMQNWDAEFINRSPLFEPLGIHGAALHSKHWPELAVLQAVVNARGTVSGGGQPLRLAPQDERSGAFGDRYEVRIYREGELQLRAHNWHDLFNLLAWVTFPRAKAALNARHYQALLDQQARGAANRGSTQDALTLFDESGMIVASSAGGLLQKVRDFQWKSLFWHNRDRVTKNMRCFVFGHALYEKALQPFVGMTGQGALIAVDRGFSALTLARQLELVDGYLAQHIADAAFFLGTRELAPVPLLGVPGWWPANQQSSFYDNTAYFRPGRRKKSQAQGGRAA
jgi:hypothetical protein